MSSAKRKVPDNDSSVQPQPKISRSTPPPSGVSRLTPVSTLINGNPILKGVESLETCPLFFSLHLVVDIVYQDDGWRGFLNRDFTKLKHCETAISRNIPCGDKGIKDVLADCIQKREWGSLFERGGPLRKSRSFQQSSEVIPELTNFQAAFKQGFVGDADILLKTMDFYKKAPNYHAQSFSIIQSSGTGKSRLIDQSAQLRFTITFNLHEDLPPTSGSFPPFDTSVRNYLVYTGNDAPNRLSTFLEILFDETVLELQDYDIGSSDIIAQRWYDWMHVGSSPTSVGTNRTEFYDRVIEKALEKLNPADSDDDLIKRLCQAARGLTRRLRQLCMEGSEKTKFMVTVCFDEAYSLRPGDSPDDPYFLLMRILSGLRDEDIFFVFLSTNSSLKAFAPTDAHYPSLRVRKGQNIIPPYFELPLDSFWARDKKQAGKLTLNGASELEHMAKFGRPLWNSYHQTLIPESAHLTIDLAKLKLDSMGFVTNQDAQLAALDCRVLIQYDPLSDSSQNTQAKLVKSYMRIIFHIPIKRHYMWSGYTSEPILAEAAAQLLAQVELHGIAECAPTILARALSAGLLARGERGELIVRTLLTIAHDIAILRTFPEPSGDILYHRPLPVLEFLKSLVTADCWNIIRKALPICGSSEKTLEEAFKDAWINFSQFVMLGNQKSFNLLFLLELLKRGAAAQACTNQVFWDFAISMLFGDPRTTNISPENGSLIFGQVKNQQDLSTVKESLESFKNITRPVISIRFELEVEKPQQPVRIHTTTEDNHPLHYAFTLYGCTSTTYACIPEGNEDYINLLRAENPEEADFSRKYLKKNLNAYRSVKPTLQE